MRSIKSLAILRPSPSGNKVQSKAKLSTYTNILKITNGGEGYSEAKPPSGCQNALSFCLRRSKRNWHEVAKATSLSNNAAAPLSQKSTLSLPLFLGALLRQPMSAYWLYSRLRAAWKMTEIQNILIAYSWESLKTTVFRKNCKVKFSIWIMT